MIVIGYQGIGKSSLSASSPGYIDLESSCFFNNDVRPDDWYIYYCQIAEHLSAQGYTVFLSSHKSVRDWMINNRLCHNVIIVCPSLHIEAEWVVKLYDRYKRTSLDKDHKAWLNASSCYKYNISELIDDMKSLDGGIVIHSIEYNLKDLLNTEEIKLWKNMYSAGV